MSENGLFLVFTNPVKGKEREFNEWYDTVHVPEVLGIPGVLSAQRFDVGVPAAGPAADAGGHPFARFLHQPPAQGDKPQTIGLLKPAGGDQCPELTE